MSNTERNEIQFQINQIRWALSGDSSQTPEWAKRQRAYRLRLANLKALLQ